MYDRIHTMITSQKEYQKSKQPVSSKSTITSASISNKENIAVAPINKQPLITALGGSLHHALAAAQTNQAMIGAKARSLSGQMEIAERKSSFEQFVQLSTEESHERDQEGET